MPGILQEALVPEGDIEYSRGTLKPDKVRSNLVGVIFCVPIVRKGRRVLADNKTQPMDAVKP